jgi:6-phosphogluconolactonase
MLACRAMSRAQEVIVVDAASLAETAAERVAALLRNVAKERASDVSLALAGGSTPRALHERLAQLPDLPWARVSIYFGDERCVPPDHADSNYRMARESLLDRVSIDPARVHRLHGEWPDREAAARAYEAELPAALDVLVLGIGEDGHTASLFPGAASLSEVERRVLPVTGPKPPPERLTITPRVIAEARHVVVLASGSGKREPVARAIEGPSTPLETPAALAREAIWILDREAASALRNQ